MRNIKSMMMVAFALVSASSMALMQPSTPISEDAPIRIAAGLKGDLIYAPFGANNFGAGLGFAHNAGYDFMWGASFGLGWASYDDRIFTKSGKESSGIRLDTEVMAAFMPEVADNFHLGGLLGVGFGRQFGNAQALNSQFGFGDLSFRTGPAFNYAFNEVFSMNVNLSFIMSNIRFSIKENAADKDNSNLLGVELPVLLSFALADYTSLFVEANTRFINFSKFGNSFRESVTLGVTFAM